MFCKKQCSPIYFAKFTGKGGLQRYRCFPVNFKKFLRTSCLQNTFGLPLLSWWDFLKEKQVAKFPYDCYLYCPRMFQKVITGSNHCSWLRQKNCLEFSRIGTEYGDLLSNSHQENHLVNYLPRVTSYDYWSFVPCKFYS